MKWHDATKEQPPLIDQWASKRVLFCFYNRDMPERKLCEIGYWNDVDWLHCQGQKVAVDVIVTHWCYVDDIPKPE